MTKNIEVTHLKNGTQDKDLSHIAIRVGISGKTIPLLVIVLGVESELDTWLES